MKQFLAILLIALFAVVFVSAQQQEADNFLLDILKGAAKDYVNKNWDSEEQADAEFFKKLEYINGNFDENVEAADIKFGKIFKKIGKIGLNLGKAYLRTKGIPLEDNEQADKFWKKLWGVVKQVGKGAIKSYVNQNFDAQSDLTLPANLKKLWRYVCIKPIRFPKTTTVAKPTTAADIKFGKIFKKIGKIGLNLGKAYLRTQGIPLEDEIAKPTTVRRQRRRVAGKRRFGGQRRNERRFQQRRERLVRRPRRSLQRRRTATPVKEEADIKFGKLFKKIGKIGLNLGKAYLRTQGIPLSDLSAPRRAVLKPIDFIPRKPHCSLNPLLRRFKRLIAKQQQEQQSDAEFFKKIGKLFKKALPYLKAGVKEYINGNFDEESDLIIRDPVYWRPIY
ncbi:hypothetical protein ABK040_003584 [Willaertia magna]